MPPRNSIVNQIKISIGDCCFYSLFKRLAKALIRLAGFQAGPTFPTIPTFPYFFLCSYFSLIFSENALLSLLFNPKMFEVTKNCNFFPRLLEVCKNWINLVRAFTMQ